MPQTAIERHMYNQTPSDNQIHLSSTLKKADLVYKIGIPILFEMNYTLYLCALCLCMKAQSLEALPLVALVLSFCGVWF